MFWKIRSTLIKEFLIHTWNYFQGLQGFPWNIWLKGKMGKLWTFKHLASNLAFLKLSCESPKVQKWQFQSSPNKELENILNGVIWNLYCNILSCVYHIVGISILIWQTLCQNPTSMNKTYCNYVPPLIM